VVRPLLIDSIVGPRPVAKHSDDPGEPDTCLVEGKGASSSQRPVPAPRGKRVSSHKRIDDCARSSPDGTSDPQSASQQRNVLRTSSRGYAGPPSGELQGRGQAWGQSRFARSAVPSIDVPDAATIVPIVQSPRLARRSPRLSVYGDAGSLGWLVGLLCRRFERLVQDTVVARGRAWPRGQGPRGGQWGSRSVRQISTVSPASFLIVLRSSVLTGSLWVPSPSAMNELRKG
jgi:hypothetical protein